jgi:hypothetical protein
MYLKRMGFISAQPKKKPLLTKLHKKKHLQWAQKNMAFEQADWENVVFSDEAMFCINEGSGKVWRQRHETDLPSCITRTVKFPQKVMVWGCLSHRGVGKLCVINGTVNAEVYVNILEHFL